MGGNPALQAHLLGEVLDDAVLRHLGANGEAALELLLDAAQQLLVLLAGEAFHPCGREEGGGSVGRDLGLPTAGKGQPGPGENMRGRACRIFSIVRKASSLSKKRSHGSFD